VKTADLDAVIASVPVDKTAARQMSGGVHWDAKKKINQTHRDAPCRMIPIPAGTPNHTGKKFGRLTVVGLIERNGHHKGPLWQVRCVCGQYETRRGKTVKNASDADMCQMCAHLEQLKRKEREWREGRNPGYLAGKLGGAA
jgi:hypothetical protein